MKTKYLSAPVTDLNPSPVAIAAWDSRSPAISQKETKRTKVRGVGFAFLLAAFLGSCVTTELRAQVIVVPNALATTDGNTSRTSPSGGPTYAREMLIFDASQFGALSGPSFLTQFAFRPDTIAGDSGPRTWTLRVFASTTSRSVAGLSTIFAQNLGTNNTLVFDGTVILRTANLPGPGNTRQFDYLFPFTRPFLYDPAAGNLLLDIQFVGNGSAIKLDMDEGNSAVNKLVNISSTTTTTGAFGFSPPAVIQFTFRSMLSVRLTETNGVLISWPAPSTGFELEQNSNLGTTNWIAVATASTTVGSEKQVIVPNPVGSIFYRLRKP